MRLRLRLISGDILAEVQAKAEWTVSDLKVSIPEQPDAIECRTRYLYGTKILSLSTRFADAGIEADADITVLRTSQAKFLTTSRDSTARLWDVSSGRCLRVLEGHNGWVSFADFSTNGSKILTCCDDGTANIWENTGLDDLDDHRSVRRMSRPLSTFANFPNFGSGSLLSPDNRHVLMQSDDQRNIMVVNIETGVRVCSLPCRSAYLRSIQCSPDSRWILAISVSSTANIWRTESWEHIRTIQCHAEVLEEAVVAPNSIEFATASSDGTAKIWDIERGNCLHSLVHANFVSSVRYSPSGEKILTTSADRTGKIWDAKTGKCIHTLSEHGHFVYQGGWSPDGKMVVTVSGDRLAIIWDTSTGKLLHILHGHDQAVRSGEFSPDADLVATTSSDGTAKVWCAKTGFDLRTLRGHNGCVFSGKFAP